MSQAKIISITPPEKHPDDWLLSLAAEWRLARLNAQLRWAEGDSVSKFCTNEDRTVDPPSEFLDKMAEMAAHLSACEPKTTTGASVLVDVILDIMQAKQRGPEDTLAEGPILEMLVNLRASLQYTEKNFRQ